MNREPLVTAATITSIVTAVIGLFVAFGLDLTGDQQTAILVLVGLVAPLVVAGLARGKVTPVAEPRSFSSRQRLP